jgi:hypothetical protein
MCYVRSSGVSKILNRPNRRMTKGKASAQVLYMYYVSADVYPIKCQPGWNRAVILKHAGCIVIRRVNFFRRVWWRHKRYSVCEKCWSLCVSFVTNDSFITHTHTHTHVVLILCLCIQRISAVLAENTSLKASLAQVEGDIEVIYPSFHSLALIID